MLDTQLSSWKKTREETQKKSQWEIFSAIQKAENGMTLFELVNELGWPVNRISGRVTELGIDGLICDSGERRENPETGRKAVVWKALQRSLSTSS